MLSMMFSTKKTGVHCVFVTLATEIVWGFLRHALGHDASAS